MAIFVDCITPINLNVSIFYSIPLVLAGLARSRRLLWILLFALLCTTFVLYAWDRASSELPGALLFDNRVIVATTMMLTAVLLHLWTHALDALERRDLQIRRQNEELEQRRQQAEESSRRKTLLFASLSHDIRTPLSLINLSARAIGSKVGGLDATGSVRAMAQQLIANTNSLATQVADILEFSTFELGQVEVHPADCVLGEVLGSLQRSLLPLAEAKGLQLLIDPLAASVCLRTDPVKLERVLTNLVMNAIKYTEHGSVRLSAGYGDTGGVRVRIQDTGVGIPPEDRERIFDEFARLQRSVQRSQSWGLGLPICRRLITLLRGSISVESRSGEGSTLIVQLPISYDGQRPRQADGPLPAAPRLEHAGEA